MPRPLRSIVVLFTLTVSGCAARTHAAGLSREHLERLYFGRDIGDTAVVSDSAWAGFVRDVLTPTFPQGATVYDARGYWRDPKGVVTHEASFVVELIHVPTPDAEGRVVAVMDAYKRRFAQQAVLRIIMDAGVSFH